MLGVALLWAGAAEAQDPPAEVEAQEEERRFRPAEPEWGLGLRFGAFHMVNSSSSYDAVYGDPLLQIGGQLELRLWDRFLVAVSADWGEVSGRRVILTPSPTPTEIGTTLTYTPAHLTVGWFVLADRPWELYLGVGPSLLSWSQSGVVRGDSGSSTGGHGVAGLRRAMGSTWSLGGDLRWTFFPDAMGEHNVSAYFGEDDMGGLTLQLLAQWRLGTRAER
jgi:hypothetical protein